MIDKDHRCGVGPFHPKWLQKLANTKCFLVVYSILGTVQGMSHIYSSTTLTTIEKRFKIPSRTLGVLLSGNEVSQIFLSLIMAYHGGRGNRPVWLAWGVVFSALSAYILALPHVLYGPGQDALSLTEEYLDESVLNRSLPMKKETPLLCLANRTLTDMCTEEDFASGEHSWTPLVLIFMSNFVLGIGVTLSHSLGQTYIDDHTKKSNTPILLGVVMSLRMLGPAIGFVFSAFCLSMYIEPSLTPVIRPKDPRWLGAWWLGWIFLGTLKLIMGFLVAFFPKELPMNKEKEETVEIKLEDGEIKKVNGNTKQENEENEENTAPEKEPLQPIPKENVKKDSKKKDDYDEDDFFNSLKRLLRNKLLICNIAASCFFITAGSGSMTFSMKYMETQYHTSAAGASMISGTASIMAMVCGFLGSGFFISKVKPRPRFILGWNVMLAFLHAVANICYIFLGCQDNGLYGLNLTTGEVNILNGCNGNCDCESVKYQPVCYAEQGMTYYSPCHIGCQSKILDTNTTKTFFTNCTCIPNLNSSMSLGDVNPSYLADPSIIVDNGPCAVDCSTMLYTYVMVGFIIHVLSSSGRVGSVLINFRCVAKKDKVFAQGLSLLCVSLFAFIPGPIIFGAMIDHACLVWDATCAERGNCWLYHKDNFRIYMNCTAAALTLVGCCVDLKVWHLGKYINLYGEEDEVDPEYKQERKQSILADMKD
ncbi:solute carrier organic anion transporter family member 74D-like [Bacillus rossius redtenbacheri]|uniref:solute carrier organic anion transporter family member 74D-like n=1 Tax=Bacillus rossius redtenbacheri TaxID=93214 RepID=UPI002FDCBA53